MKNINNILVPVDFSEESLMGISAGCQLAELFNSTINFVHFIDPQLINESLHPKDATQGNTDTLFDRRLKTIENDALKKQSLIMQELVAKSLHGNVHVVNSSLSDSLSKFVDDTHMDMIVMGTSATKSLLEEVMGSNTEKTIRTAGIPVLSVSSYRKIYFDNILIPTDLSQNIPESLFTFCRYMEKHGSKIHFANFITTDLISKSEVRDKMNSLAKAQNISNYRLHISHAEQATMALLELAEELKPDLIMMKTYEKTSFWSFISGSIAEKTVREIGLPTLLEQV